jgi:hypothetical protein
MVQRDHVISDHGTREPEASQSQMPRVRISPIGLMWVRTLKGLDGLKDA